MESRFHHVEGPRESKKTLAHTFRRTQKEKIQDERVLLWHLLDGVLCFWKIYMYDCKILKASKIVLLETTCFPSSFFSMPDSIVQQFRKIFKNSHIHQCGYNTVLVLSTVRDTIDHRTNHVSNSVQQKSIYNLLSARAQKSKNIKIKDQGYITLSLERERKQCPSKWRRDYCDRVSKESSCLNTCRIESSPIPRYSWTKINWCNPRMISYLFNTFKNIDIKNIKSFIHKDGVSYWEKELNKKLRPHIKTKKSPTLLK